VETLDLKPTTYPVSDFLQWQRQGTLDLRPPYQRRSVWSQKAKSLLVDSIVRGFPIPLIFLHSQIDLKKAASMRQVVDGQQRIRTLLAYVDATSLGKSATPEDEFTMLKVHNPELHGLTFGELPDESRTKILETHLPVIVLPSGISDTEILRIFQRMNSTGLKLNPQELRNAEFYGTFKTVSYALAYEQNPRWLSWGLFTQSKIAQMLEVEFTSDLLGLALEGVKARTKATIDKLYRDYDDVLDEQEAVEQWVRSTIELLDAIFGRSRSPQSLKRFRSTAWTYSAAAVLTDIDRFSLQSAPRSKATTGAPQPADPDAVARSLERIDTILRSASIDDKTLKPLRGATSDRRSREHRIDFIRNNL
jgi:hypothetical protein